MGKQASGQREYVPHKMNEEYPRYIQALKMVLIDDSSEEVRARCCIFCGEGIFGDFKELEDHVIVSHQEILGDAGIRNKRTV